MTSSPQKQDMGAISDWFEERPINKACRQKQSQMLRDRLSFPGVDWVDSSDGTGSGKEVRMLDYACGSGFVSKIFEPHVSSIKAIDASPSMIERYNANTASFGLAEEKIVAMVGNLLSSPPEPASLVSEDYDGFDLIAVGAALHSFPSAGEAIQRLAERLKPGGVLYIQDLLASQSTEGVEPPEGKVKRPRGYTESDLKDLMEKAGLSGFRFEVLPEDLEIEIMSEEVFKIQCFIVRAAKPTL